LPPSGLAAVLVWEVEHVGSVVLALAIAVVAVSIGVIISRRLRANIDDLTDYYEGLLRIAGEQSRQAESANHLKDEATRCTSPNQPTPRSGCRRSTSLPMPAVTRARRSDDMGDAQAALHRCSLHHLRSHAETCVITWNRPRTLRFAGRLCYRS